MGFLLFFLESKSNQNKWREREREEEFGGFRQMVQAKLTQMGGIYVCLYIHQVEDLLVKKMNQFKYNYAQMLFFFLSCFCMELFCLDFR